MRKFYSLLVALFALVGVTQAQTITFTAGTDVGTQTDAGKGADQVTKDGITISVTKGALAAAQYRFGKSQTVTITSTVGDIVQIVFTCTASGDAQYGPGNFKGDGYSYSEKVGTWTGEAASVSLLAETAQVRATKIEVTVKNSDPNYVAAPKITPETGTYYAAQEVTIEVAEGTTVYYTTDGTEPTASSTAYTAPFTVSATTTVKAIAVKGENKSEVAVSEITIAELAVSTIADVLAQQPSETGVKVSATVVALAKDGLLLQDATGFIYAYTEDAPTVAVGDVCNVSGPTALYPVDQNYGRIQFNKPLIEKTSTTTVEYPTAEELDANAFDALVAAPVVKFVKVTGTVNISGSYYNLKISGAKKTGSIVASQEILNQLENNMTVTLTGYYVYSTGSVSNNVFTPNYGNIIVTKAEIPEITYVEYSTFAAVKAAAPADEASATYAQLNVTDALVAFVKSKSVYLFDGADGILIYGDNKNIKTGDKISGTIKGKLFKRYGNTQLAVTAYDVTVASSDNAVVPTEISASELNANGAKYENMLITVKGLVPNAEAWDNNNIVFAYEDEDTEEKGTVAVRDNFGIGTGMTFDKNAAYTVTGFVSVYTKDDATTIQVYPREKADIDNGVKYVFAGEGTLEKPYTAKDIQNMDSEHASEGVWVKAYIVGYIGGSSYNATNAIFSATAPEGKEVYNSNLILADAADCTNYTQAIPVALPAGKVARTDLNLKDHADKLGVQVWLKGNAVAYMGAPGLKEVAEYSLDGVTIISGVGSLKADAKSAGAIYNLAGQRVTNTTRRGIYIMKDRKVLISK